MPDDRFKRYQDAGNDFLETARTRAEEFLRELARATESTQKSASDQVDDLVSAGRRGTDQLFDVIRREVSSQLSTLGLATQHDLEALERRLTGKVAAAKKAAPAKKATASKAAGAKKAAGTKKAGATKAAGTKKASPAKKATATKKAPGASKATGTGPTTS